MLPRPDRTEYKLPATIKATARQLLRYGNICKHILHSVLRNLTGLRAYGYYTWHNRTKRYGLLVIALLLTVSLGYWQWQAGSRTEVTVQDAGVPVIETITPDAIVNTSPKSQQVAVKAPISAYAPLSAEQLRDDATALFIRKYGHIAVAEMHRYDIPASIKLAQALIESRAGTSRLSRENNNHFGMKCFSRKCGKGHCTNHFDDHHKDFFRKFDTSWESWREHSKFLKKPRYAGLVKHGKDYKKWAHGLKAAGYATDERYAYKLIKVIEKYDLHRLDYM